MRSGLRLAVLGCLVGSALVLLALSRTWLSYDVGGPSPLPSRRVSFQGSDLVNGARGLGLLALAAVAALLAARSWGRQLVGAIVLAAGCGLMVLVARTLADPAASAPRPVPVGPWPAVALVGAALVAAAGLLVLVRGRRWTTLGSRFQPAAAEPRAAERDPWAALDRGEDPTGIS